MTTNGSEKAEVRSARNHAIENTEIQMGWTGLLEAYRNHWHGCGMSAEEINIYIGVSAREFLKAGWLRQELRAEGHLFWPAGQLKDALERDDASGAAEAQSSKSKDQTEIEPPIHVSTFPIPHIVPAPSASDTARQPRPEAIPPESSTAMAGAAASASSRGRWDANPVETSPVMQEMAAMIGVLKVAGEEVRLKWLDLAQTQDLKGWKDIETIANGTAHLRRLASDLFNHMADAEFRIELARRVRR